MTNLSNTPDMTAPAPLDMNQTLSDWLDSRFLQSLLQRGQRPGLIRFRQAQAIQTRMANMALGQPLAAALQQRFAASVASDAAALPIVFVQPQPFSPEPPAHATAPPAVIPTTAPKDHPPFPETAEMPLAEGVIQRVAGPANSGADKTERPQPLPSGIKSGGVSYPPQGRTPGEAVASLSPPQPFHASESRAVTTRQQPALAAPPTAPSMTKLPVVTAVVQRIPSLSDNENESDNKPLRERPPVITTKTAANLKQRPTPVPFSSALSMENESAVASQPLPLQISLHRNETSPSPLLPIASWSQDQTVAAPTMRSLPVVEPQRAILDSDRGTHAQGLPLARPTAIAAAGVIQRTPASPLAPGTTSNNRPTIQANRSQVAVAGQSAIIQRAPVTDPPAAANDPDIEQMATKLQRKLLRHLEIEAERRGVKPWT